MPHQSDTTTNLFSKLSKIQNEVGVIIKGEDSVIGTRKYKYADLTSVVQQTKPVLDKYNVIVTHLLDEDVLFTRVTDIESGEFTEEVARLFLVRDDPQAQGSAITYARRYSYVTILGLLTDEDDDGAAASPGNGAAKFDAAKFVATVTRPSPMASASQTTQQTAIPQAYNAESVKVGPGDVTAPQIKKMGYEFGRTGFSSDEQRHTYAGLLVGRDIDSLTDLTKREASQLIEALVGEPDGEDA